MRHQAYQDTVQAAPLTSSFTEVRNRFLQPVIRAGGGQLVLLNAFRMQFVPPDRILMVRLLPQTNLGIIILITDSTSMVTC